MVIKLSAVQVFIMTIQIVFMDEYFKEFLKSSMNISCNLTINNCLLKLNLVNQSSLTFNFQLSILVVGGILG